MVEIRIGPEKLNDKAFKKGIKAMKDTIEKHKTSLVDMIPFIAVICMGFLAIICVLGYTRIIPGHNDPESASAPEIEQADALVDQNQMQAAVNLYAQAFTDAGTRYSDDKEMVFAVQAEAALKMGAIFDAYGDNKKAVVWYLQHIRLSKQGRIALKRAHQGKLKGKDSAGRIDSETANKAVDNVPDNSM